MGFAEWVGSEWNYVAGARGRHALENAYRKVEVENVQEDLGIE